jgi:hypothetical protein
LTHVYTYIRSDFFHTYGYSVRVDCCYIWGGLSLVVVNAAAADAAAEVAVAAEGGWWWRRWRHLPFSFIGLSIKQNI